MTEEVNFINYKKLKLNKKLIIIFGMGPGVSNSVAKKFAGENFRLALIARNADRLNEYKKNLESGGTEAEVFTADASDEDSIINTFGEIKSRMGDADVLHYNVYSMRQALPQQLNYQDCINDFKINTAGALLSSQLVLPAMLEKKEGCILFTGGGLSLDPLPLYCSLGIGKAGIRNLCFSLYADLKSKNIHAATVTIKGYVKPGTKWDPDNIAEAFWKLYQQKQVEFEREIII